MLVCLACGGRNAANSAACVFCQHPFGAYRRRWLWPGRRALVLLWLLLMGALLLALVSRATLLPTTL